MAAPAVARRGGSLTEARRGRRHGIERREPGGPRRLEDGERGGSD